MSIGDVCCFRKRKKDEDTVSGQRSVSGVASTKKLVGVVHLSSATAAAACKYQQLRDAFMSCVMMLVGA